MNSEPVDTLQALEIISTQGVMVTATKRLARFWEIKYARFCRENGQTVWPTPSIIPLAAWLEHLFSRLPPGQKEYFLSPDQELFLWEKIIEQTSTHSGLMGFSALAGDCLRTLATVKAHQIPDQEIQAMDDEQGRIFAELFKEFTHICTRKNFIPRACLPDRLIREFSRNPDLVPEKLIVQGFLDFTPQEKHFLDSLHSRGCRILTVQNNIRQPVRQRAVYDSFRSEAEAAARWARAWLEKEPGARIGLIVPELAGLRQEIMRVFDQVFHPEYVLHMAEPRTRAYNISLGSSLVSFPLVSSAMNFLELLASPEWEIDDLEEILFSPFFQGADTELQARSSLALKLRQGSRPWHRPQDILKLASDPGKECHAPVLADLLTRSLDRYKNRPDSQIPGSWAGFISRILLKAGWPGGRPLNSAEYQTFQAFKEELSRLASLEAVSSRTFFPEIKQAFKQQLSRRIFQPETPETQVQILGLKESAGLVFDHLWVMNCSSDTLPEPARPDPLLPVELQAGYLIPGASPETRLRLADLRFGMLSESAESIIFSHTCLDQDQYVAESPLIRDLPLVPSGEIPGVESLDIPALFHDPSSLEKAIDDHGLPLTETRLQGGVRIFKEQAECPFKGYAGHRLGAAPIQEPELALTALERGILVHNALKKFWDEAGSLQELQEIKQDNALNGYIQEVCSAVLNEWICQEHVLLTESFLELEHQRLCRILSGWLRLELERGEFEVLAHEKKEEVTVSGLSIQTRLDRLDRIGPDQLVIIDYKTGSSPYILKNIWMEDRLLEPQLPIYALITGRDTSGVALAMVHPAVRRFQGIINPEHKDIMGSKLSTPDKFGRNDLQEIIALWREKLENLAGEIKDGLALADPFLPDENKICMYCGLMPLCRIRSSRPF